MKKGGVSLNNAFLSVKLDNLEEVNKGLSRARLLIANYGKNKKKFNIPKEVFEKAIPSLLGAPVVAHFFQDGELGGHEDDLVNIKGDLRRTGKTYAYGFVDYINPPYWKIEGGKEWLCAIVYIFTERFPESKKILNSGHSMEVALSMKDTDSEGYVNVNELRFLALCALNPVGINPTFFNSRFERFSFDEVEGDLKSMKKEFETFAINEDVLIKPSKINKEDNLIKIVNALKEEYGYECSDKEKEEIYKEFECGKEEFAIPEKYKHIDFKPPKTVAEAAQRGLDMRAKQPDSNKCCTAVGLARARQLTNRQQLSPSTVKRMLSYFERHEVDKKGKDWDNQSKGRQAWLIWGGDPGYTWAKKVVSQMKKADEKKNMSLEQLENMAIEKGVSDSIQISTDGSKAIEGIVGEKDVAVMKRKVFMAKNYKEAIPKIFARYPDDLSGDFNMSDVGYPLMSERDGMFYYNTGFIKAASSRIEQNSDQPYYEKVRKNIVKARKAVNMPEEFSKGGLMLEDNMMKDQGMAMDGDMMKKAMMAMYGKYGMRYMPYGMDGKYIYAMDNDKEMAKMMIPYAMKDEKMFMDYDGMMAMDYKDDEMAIKIAMGILYDKLMEMKNKYMAMEAEKVDMMEKYSAAEEKIKEFSNLSSKESEALKKVIDLKASLEAKDARIEELESQNKQFSEDLEVVKSEKRKSEAENILNKKEFSIFSDEEKKELLNLVDKSDIETFTLKVESKAWEKVLTSKTFSTKEQGILTMGNPTKFSRDDSTTDDYNDVFDKLEQKIKNN